MEVTSVLLTRYYDINDVEGVPIIKTLHREGRIAINEYSGNHGTRSM